MSVHGVARLTERQRECLRLLFDHYKPGEIAGRLGISTDRVNQHLKAAREKLGVTRSIDAARILAAAEKLPSPSVGDHSLGLSERSSAGDQASSSSEDAATQDLAVPAGSQASPASEWDTVSSPPFWPVPTSARPFNELRWYQKLGWAIGVALAATVLAGAMVSLQDAIH